MGHFNARLYGISCPVLRSNGSWRPPDRWDRQGFPTLDHECPGARRSPCQIAIVIFVGRSDCTDISLRLRYTAGWDPLVELKTSRLRDRLVALNSEKNRSPSVSEAQGSPLHMPSGALERWVVLFRRPLHGALDTPEMNQGSFPRCSCFDFTEVVAEIFAERVVAKRAVLSARSTTSNTANPPGSIRRPQLLTLNG